MLTIRFTRKGKKNQPSFRIIVVDKRKSSKAGSFIEDLGFFNPLTKKKAINKERATYWISVGAKPSGTVHNLLVAEKIIDAKKINVVRIKKSSQLAQPSEAPKEAAAPAQPETPSANQEQVQ